MPLHRRVPKRGFTNIFRKEYVVVNVDRIAEVFEAGTAVTPELLREKGLVPGGEAPVKVLARGDVAKALTIKAHKFSGKAAEKIAAAGGTAEVLLAERTAALASCRQRYENDRQLSEYLSGRRAQEPGALHARHARRVSHRQPRRGARREHRGAGAARRAGAEHDVRPLRHVLGAEPVEDDDLRARHHAVHQRVDHPAAPHRGVAVSRTAVARRRAGPPQDHAVHALRHHRPVDRAGVGDRDLPRASDEHRRRTAAGLSPAAGASG